MHKKLIKIFQEAKYKSDINLTENIWQAIVSHEKYIVRVKLWVFSVVGFVSLVGLVPAFKMLSSDLTQSGFYKYFSLIFSNSELIISYWKELIFSLAESLPTISIIFTLSLVFIFFLSLKYLIKQIINNNQLFPQGNPV